MALTFTPTGADTDAGEFASLIAQLQSTSPTKRAGGKLCIAAHASDVVGIPQSNVSCPTTV